MSEACTACGKPMNPAHAGRWSGPGAPRHGNCANYAEMPRVRVVGVPVLIGGEGPRRWLYEAQVPLEGGIVERRLCRSWADAMAYTRDAPPSALINRRGHWTRPASAEGVLRNDEGVRWA